MSVCLHVLCMDPRAQKYTSDPTVSDLRREGGGEKPALGSRQLLSLPPEHTWAGTDGMSYRTPENRLYPQSEQLFPGRDRPHRVCLVNCWGWEAELINPGKSRRQLQTPVGTPGQGRRDFGSHTKPGSWHFVHISLTFAVRQANMTGLA